MTVLTFGLVTVAGFFAGIVGYVTGIASLISYPALLAAGLSPVSANVTNTVAMVAVGAGSTAKAGAAVADDARALALHAGCAALGGLGGAMLLLTTPAEIFDAVVPVLIALASVSLLVQPKLRALAGNRTFPRLYPLGTAVVALYGGYFGAGAGVMFLALILVCTSETIWRASVLKSVLTGVANLVAAVGFAIFGPVHWLAAAAMGIGAFAGGWFGPALVARLPPAGMRIGVALCGVGLAGYLAIT
ncbi:sulfite exporter TauE/SafE family protein [Nocardia flavorosea]|uniref:Probable membrane transporter protein n=1 Tax=Nocardia flavorosea TaxID=53429 RepID=A0A846YDQ6_9NOCA|nr:sulfite exporter TauE/SafE family protein [Nocardia flavorosea]NKY54929.1 sulfite exporter TauE/SafE family protein [Nocardia flavorosea]